MAPNIYTKHITLPPITKMRVNLAAQIPCLSDTAGINTLCALGQHPDEARSTAEFMETFGQLFYAF